MFVLHRVRFCLAILAMASLAATSFAEDKAADTNVRDLVTGAKRVLLLGDSITHAGEYAAFFDVWLLTQKLDARPTIIDAGLPSETVSGLSEDGHAGGKFPRPDLAERLDRVLKVAKPDLVIACYGMNCGIYQPFDEERFELYQKGVRNLKEKVEAAGAKLVVVTPPQYDDMKGNQRFSYNGVLGRYSQWLLERRKDGWTVIDLHGPMTAAVAERRKREPYFTFQPDAVHPNSAGNWFIASVLIKACGDDAAAAAGSPQEMLAQAKLPPEVLGLVQQRMNVLRDAYVGAAGHKRPGIGPGLPIQEADAKAKELTGKIEELMKK